MMATNKRAAPQAKKAKAKAKETSAQSTGAQLTSEALGAELSQLEAIRAKFAPLDERTSEALYALYSDAQCRELGTGTKAAETFRGAMSWARTLGKHPRDAAVNPIQARWFLDCLTALGHALNGKKNTFANPSHAANLADAEKHAKKLVQRTTRRLRDAAGANADHHAAIDQALSHDGLGSKEAAQCRNLAKLCRDWLAGRRASPLDFTDDVVLVGPASPLHPNRMAPPVALFGVTHQTVDELEDAARKISDLVATTPAARAVQRDGPETNAAEGRLLYAMRTLWDDAAEAREDGHSTLQFTVNPAILRGLNLESRHRKAAGPTPTNP